MFSLPFFLAFELVLEAPPGKSEGPIAACSPSEGQEKEAPRRSQLTRAVLVSPGTVRSLQGSRWKGRAILFSAAR